MPKIDIPNTLQFPVQILDVALRDLSPSAFKILCVTVNHTLRFGKRWDWISTSQFASEAGMSTNAAATAAKECLEREWLARIQRCSLCKSIFEGESIPQTTQPCPFCGRRVSVEYLYALNMGEEVLQQLSYLYGSENERFAGGRREASQTNPGANNGATQNLHSPPQNLRTPTQNMGRGAEQEMHSPTQIMGSPLRSNPTQIMGSPTQNLHRQVTKETNLKRNVSETRFRGKDSETEMGQKSLKKHSGRLASQPALSAEAWRKETEDLARYSASELDDANSLGMHITVWNHARRIDQQRGNPPVITDGLFEILRQLIERRKSDSSPKPQGKAWTQRTRKWFEDNGFPLLVREDMAELLEVRQALAEAHLDRNDA